MDQIHALVTNAGFRILSVNKIHFSQNTLDIIIKELNMKIQDHLRMILRCTRLFDNMM